MKADNRVRVAAADAILGLKNRNNECGISSWNPYPMDDALETVRNEDYVEYFLFVRTDGSGEEDAEELVKRANGLNAKVLGLVDRLSDQYIWHKDRFNLIPRFCPSAELRQSFPDTSDGKHNAYLIKHNA